MEITMTLTVTPEQAAAIAGLLAEFGAPAGLASVPENRRAEFAGRLRQMGGQI